MGRSALRNEHRGLESKSNVIQILSQYRVTSELLISRLLSIKGIYLLIELVALIIDLL